MSGCFFLKHGVVLAEPAELKMIQE